MNEPIHIVVATDYNYLIHTQTLLKSIEENHRASIVYHILAFNLSDAEKGILKSTVTTYEYRFYNLSDEYIKKRLFSGCSHLHQDRSLAAFARLLIPELIDRSINRCIYMDVDAIVLQNLSELYSLPLSEFAIAGVLDTNPQKRHSSVGLSPDMTYINSGMILWNLDYCRKTNVVDRFVKFIEKYNGRIDAMDQGTINGTLSSEIMPIHPKYNALTSFFQLNAKQISEYYNVKTYSDSQLKDAVTSPVFVHFTPNMTSRPWVMNCKHPLKSEYWRYRLAVNPEYYLTQDTRTAKIRILSWMFYHLPWSLFINILSISQPRNTHRGGVIISML